MQIDTIQQRSRQPRSISLDLILRTRARARRMAKIGAVAGVHRRDERESRWIGHDRRRASDHDAPVLQRLPERLERVARKLEQLVEKEDAVVSETHLAWTR